MKYARVKTKENEIFYGVIKGRYIYKLEDGLFCKLDKNNTKNESEIQPENTSVYIIDNGDSVQIKSNGIHISEKNGHSVDIGMNGKIKVNGNDYKRSYDKRIFPISIVVIIAFLMIGMWKGLWHPAWLLFLTIPIVESLIKAISNRNAHHFTYPVFVALVYLCLGFFGGFWYMGWIVFLTIPIYYTIFRKDNRQ